ncbi:hypothetical protein ATO13_23796 [Stappia sp. 22II-S9-Z10]|nr:hypothetical protein ATO13_23796 [Stappia sp. 22II-S9-Z10]
MTVFAFLFANPKLSVAIAAAVAAVLAVGGAYLAGRDDGSDAATARVERQDRVAEDTADEAWRATRYCADTGGTWDVSTGRCT